MIRLLRAVFSSGTDSAGSPSGWGIPRAGMIRLAPTVVAILVSVQMRAVGIPAFSSSFAIVAPQRVPVPQVAVKMTPTFSLIRLRISSAMAVPKRVAFSTEVALPDVV